MLVMDAQTVAPILVGGDWVRTGGPPVEVTSPYTGEVVARVARADGATAREAIARADQALRVRFPAHARIAVLDRTARAIADEAERLARIIALEVGKPLRWSRAEVARAESTFRFAAAEASRIEGETLDLGAAPGGDGRIAYTVREPVGVVGAITPFNFPLNLVSHKLAPAVAAGCSVVLKPATATPLSALALAELLEQAGLPGGYLSVLVGPAGPIGDTLIEDERVRLLTFTGSGEVGWELRRRAARKQVALELGNNSPSIVAADADLEDAAAKLAVASFSNSGQACISVQRIIVDEQVHDRFVGLLLDQVGRLVAGDPFDDRTDVGPVIDRREQERILGWIAEAVDGGGRVLAGGEVVDGILAPTVLADVDPQARVCASEVFGPVVTIERCAGVDDGLARANASVYGLQASIFTRELAAAMRAAGELRYAGVLVNEAPTFRLDQMPYGGIKESGNTREGPRYALQQMLEQKLVIVNPGSAA